MLLTLEAVSKAYGDNQVLNGVSLTVDTGQKIGLVGANGVGKSTLLKIITGEVEADTGYAKLGGGTDLGYLPQVLHNIDDQTVDGLIMAAQGCLCATENRMREVEQLMVHARDDLEPLLAEYGRLSELFERRGGYDLDHRIDSVLAGLGVAHLPRNRPVSTLSGGEKSRVGLAALLLRAPELLLLDEPTNHLDFAALEWLEGFLHTYRGGLLVVSHDRHFLNQTVGAIVEIEEHSREAKLYNGSYDFYAQIKAMQRVKWTEEYWQQQEEIRELRRAIKGKARQVAHNRPPRDGDKFLAYFKSERIADAVARNVHAAEEKLRRIEEDPIPKPPKELKINPQFDPASLVSRSPLVVAGVRKRYGEQVILDGIDFALQPDSHVAIIGPNGAGKTTLLRILAGLEQADEGYVDCAASVIVGYLDQEQETLAEELPLLEAYRDERIGDFEEFKAELLGYGLFVYPDLAKRVGTLSAGQKRKLQIAQLIARRANLLLLDEPTNHISLDTLEEFEKALVEFPGPVIAVSHDRRFLSRFASGRQTGEIWELRDGRLSRFLGGWDEYTNR